MNETIALLGGDARTAALARLLREDGYGAETWGLELYGLPSGTSPEEAARADRVILPVPLSREKGMLNGAPRPLPLETLWALLSGGPRVYAGGVGSEELASASARGVRLFDYLAREELAVRNAIPTAEGAIQIAMERLPVTLHGTPCLVVGCGRVGKALAHRLYGLGARVSVSARKRADLAWIGAFGYDALRTDALEGELVAFRVIFNTVPHEVLSAPLLEELRKDCLLVELASANGFDPERARRLGLPFVKAGGLPGKVAPETAARAIRETLYEMWEEEV